MEDLWSPRMFGAFYPSGLVEGYFLKANSPDNEKALWIRYSFVRKRVGGHESAKVWIILTDFSGAVPSVAAVRETIPIQRCRYDAASGELHLGDNLLTPTLALGALSDAEFQIQFGRSSEAFRVMPAAMYSDLVPTMKFSTPRPETALSGQVTLGAATWSLEGWKGSLGHNWGRKYPARVAWGQVAAAVSGRPLRFEGFSIPISPRSGPDAHLTMGRLSLGEQVFSFHSPYSVLHNQCEVDSPGEWRFVMENWEYQLSGTLTFPTDKAVAGLRYVQPDGRLLHCLHSVSSSASLHLKQRSGSGDGISFDLEVKQSAALEFLTPDLDHRFNIMV